MEVMLFLLSSKKGSKELVSLLQYMKETTLENPNILVRDKRILELDNIVSEVKESEEWEAIQMNILEIGIQKGREEARKEEREKAIQALIESFCELQISQADTIAKIKEKFSLSDEEAKGYIRKYWK